MNSYISLIMEYIVHSILEFMWKINHSKIQGVDIVIINDKFSLKKFLRKVIQSSCRIFSKLCNQLNSAIESFIFESRDRIIEIWIVEKRMNSHSNHWKSNHRYLKNYSFWKEWRQKNSVKKTAKKFASKKWKLI